MRRVVYSAWRVFYSCLVMGAWSCLSQDMDFERHATLLFCAKSVSVQGNGAEGDEEYMVFNHGMHRIHGMTVLLVLLFGVAVSAVAAEPGITVEAWQRYPWNGLVNLKFTITGESGTKYDTSFTAKDMVGGTNVAMKTIRKSNGVAAEEKEKLLPGTYNWVWDAAADLPNDFKCERMTVTGESEKEYDKVQLWEGGPYWATRNIGADEPWEAGYYFWWGDTIGYKWENNAWVTSDGLSTGSPFGGEYKPTCDMPSTLKNEGWITADNTLTLEKDAAHVKWGDAWRMPTLQDFKDLESNCNWVWSTLNDVNGFVIYGKGDYANNSIFLPSSGYSRGVSMENGNSGYYWSSSLTSVDAYIWYSGGLYFSGSFYDGYIYYSRSYGMPIRPVQSPTK